MGTFKERVRDVAIATAKVYNQNLVGYEYLVCSRAFAGGYKEIKADGNNFMHLVGVNSDLSADEFWNRCLDGTLSEDDFDFNKRGQDAKSVKGSVRQKIQVLRCVPDIFDLELRAQEDFRKNRIECAFATSDGSLTLGFAASGRPKSLMKSDELSDSAMNVDLVFRRSRNSSNLYSELYHGNRDKITEYLPLIHDLIDLE